MKSLHPECATSCLRTAAWHLLQVCDAQDKAQRVRAFVAAIDRQHLQITQDAIEVSLYPGRPERPALVPPNQVPRRRNHAQHGHAALMHAITHIEFNAINLALDAIARFSGMAEAFYWDWLQVAEEEAKHFQLLNAHLAHLGFHYGDFPAHDGLWDMAIKTSHDPLVRMALVPRVLEARGLDVTPGMMDKLRASGDMAAVAILELILSEEIGHVAIGTRWFNSLCAQRGLEPFSTFAELLHTYFQGDIRGPFHEPARLAAGFTPEELALLNARSA